MSATDLHENDLDNLPPVEPQPATVRNDTSAVRTVLVPDEGYEGIPYTKCECGKWFHAGWFQRHDCVPASGRRPLRRTRGSER